MSGKVHGFIRVSSQLANTYLIMRKLHNFQKQLMKDYC